jgi:hypothetical protein
MERVSSATAAEVEDAISTDQSGRSGKKRAKVRVIRVLVSFTHVSLHMQLA